MTMRQLPVLGGHPTSFGGTLRSDAWWVGPLITFVVFTSFIVYATFRVFEGAHYYAEPYLSPFYSPVIFTNLAAPGAAPVEHALFGEWPKWWPAFFLLPASPGLLILPFPALFRFTCYYYRKAYYRSFVGSPPGCAVSPGVRPKYNGETTFLVFQNLHRYALYFAIAYIFILSYDALLAYSRNGELGVGLGSIILTINPILLGAYTFGCHAFRHLIGGRNDCMSCGQQTLQYRTWKGVSFLNARHMGFAWVSLIWVAFTDVYVRLVSTGAITDPNTWN
jgi:hypothetical protein